MASQTDILARVRKLVEGIDSSSPDTAQQPTLNDQLELLMAFGSSPYGEITRIGRAFEVHITTAAAVAVDMPTTAHLIGIWNGEPDGGRSYIIDRCWAFNLATAAAAGTGLALVGCLGQTRVASLATASLAFNALNGNAGKDTKAINTTTALDAVTGVKANWRLLPGQSSGGGRTPVASFPGLWVNAEVNGRIIVPPGRLFAIHALADTTATTVYAGIEWHERMLRLG